MVSLIHVQLVICHSQQRCYCRIICFSSVCMQLSVLAQMKNPTLLLTAVNSFFQKHFTCMSTQISGSNLSRSNRFLICMLYPDLNTPGFGLQNHRTVQFGRDLARSFAPSPHFSFSVEVFHCSVSSILAYRTQHNSCVSAMTLFDYSGLEYSGNSFLPVCLHFLARQSFTRLVSLSLLLTCRKSNYEILQNKKSFLISLNYFSSELNKSFKQPVQVLRAL